MLENTVSLVRREIEDMKLRQENRQFFCYSLSGEVDSPLDSTLGNRERVSGKTFYIPIEQESDFHAQYMVGSAFSYSTTLCRYPYDVVGENYWSQHGLTLMISDAAHGRAFTSGWIPFELIYAPGYSTGNFQSVFPFSAIFYRNSSIRFDLHNHDQAGRTHAFEIGIFGYKVREEL